MTEHEYKLSICAAAGNYGANGEPLACGYPAEHEGSHAWASLPTFTPVASHPRKPTVVCLCGSTRFSQAFREANLRETLAGRIVLSIGCDMRSDAEIFGAMPEEELTAIKARLDELHLRKIDIADEILVLNVGGYIGQSTARELDYAWQAGKGVRYLEPEGFATVHDCPRTVSA